MTRRTFILAGLGATGALMLGVGLLPPRQRLRGRRGLPTEGGQVALNGWVKVAPDGTVTIIVPKAEMGQGVLTAAAMILAEELEVDWTSVRVEDAPVDPIYNNLAVMVDGLPFHPDDTGRIKRTARWLTTKWMREFGFMVTGGSSSMTDLWGPMGDAGAMAREAFRAAAAAQWQVPAETCRVEGGAVRLNERRLGFGQLVGSVLEHLPKTWTRKDVSEYTIIGRPRARLDAASKADGTAVFGLDAAPADARYAAVALPPTLGATVAGYDAAAARALPGVRAVVPLAGGRFGHLPGVAIVADTWWHATRALDALAVQWTPGAGATFSSVSAAADLEARATRGDGFEFLKHGDLVAPFKRAAFSVEAFYGVPYLAHAAMEPVNCTVRVAPDGVDVWVGTQVPGVAVKAVAEVVGVEQEAVRLHQRLVGGAFGRRLIVDFVAMAAEIAKQVPGTAVQLLWSREQDMRHGVFRPMVRAKLIAALDGDGKLLALHSASAGQAMLKGWGRFLGDPMLANIPDKTTVEGLTDQPYAIPALRVIHDAVDLPVPVASWRSVGHSYTAFLLESFLDECAAVKQLDPVQYRLGLLADHPRAKAVLQLVADKAGWGTPLAPPAGGGRVGRGVALHWSYQAYVAQVIEVEVSPANALRVRRVVVAVDCGLVINPDGVRQQVESGVLYGLSAALHGEITFEGGAAVQGNFHDYPAVRFAASPVIETHLVLPGDAPPGGVGEVAVPGVAPAIANALFAAGAGRVRTLPIRLAPPEATT
ncbi:MAG: molybdopterin cofactor-binding domain-containing protein [Gemmatimonadota bacterium]